MHDVGLTLLTAIERYKKDCLAREQSPRTVEGKASSLGLFAKWCLSRDIRTLSDISLSNLEQYRHYVFEYVQPSKNIPLDMATRRNRLTAVKTFLRRCYELFYIESDPSERFRLPKRAKRIPRGVLSQQQVNCIFEQVPVSQYRGTRDRAILETYWAAAIRRSELGNLKVKDVDLDKRRLTILSGKGNRDRIVPVAPRTIEWLTRYLNESRPKLETFASDDYLFLNDAGLQYEGKRLSALVTKYKRWAGVEASGACNIFRNTAATAMLDAGADIRYVQEYLGHEDISTTQVYLSVSKGKLQEVYEKTHPAMRFS